jgi:hypothetical protein
VIKLKLAFQGSRSLKNRKGEVLKIIEAEIKKHKPEIIITSGEPDGVCRIAQLYCRQNKITLKLYYASFRKHARGAWHHRSKAIIGEADYIIFIHDGKSRGTRNELKMAIKFGKLYKYYRLDNMGHKQNDEAEIEKDWDWNDNEFIGMDI